MYGAFNPPRGLKPAARGWRLIAHSHLATLAFAVVLALAVTTTAVGDVTRSAGAPPKSQHSITDTSVHLPTWGELIRVLMLRDHNTRVVVMGVTCLGLASGLIGCFMLLRKRALLGDALSHATLPGIGIAFIAMTLLGAEGKSLPGLLLGATISGVTGVALILLIVHTTRIKEDAALGIVLSVFFGLGIAVLGVVQNMSTGHAAGLESFINGKTASMLTGDAMLIAVAAAIIAVLSLALFKDFTVLCFDAEYAASIGRPVVLLDCVMMALVVGVTVIGLQAVGLILMIALLIIPPAAARFWTHHLPTMMGLAAAIGAASGLFGAALSALVPRLPAGAVIVVAAGVFFALSMILGPARGVLARMLDHHRLNRKILRQHLLRAMYEVAEARQAPIAAGPVRTAASWESLLRHRSWNPGRLRRELQAAMREGLMTHGDTDDTFRLTDAGLAAAWRVVRNHRLWEMYLIAHADIAPSHVDRDADEVEHVLEADMIQELETLLADRHPNLLRPPSPHRLGGELATALG